jgi:hypothetical protein
LTQEEGQRDAVDRAIGGAAVVGLFVMKFMGPPPHAFVPRTAIVVLMLLVAFASAQPATGEFSTTLMVINIGLGLVLLYWYVRE